MTVNSYCKNNWHCSVPGSNSADNAEIKKKIDVQAVTVYVDMYVKGHYTKSESPTNPNVWG